MIQSDNIEDDFWDELEAPKIDLSKPQIGDYVICDIPHHPENRFISASIGKIFNAERMLVKATVKDLQGREYTDWVRGKEIIYKIRWENKLELEVELEYIKHFSWRKKKLVRLLREQRFDL